MLFGLQWSHGWWWGLCRGLGLEVGVAGVGSILLGVAVHRGAHKVRVDSRPGELISLIPLALHRQVARHSEGERRAGWQRPAQVGSQVGQQVLLEAGDGSEDAAAALLALLTTRGLQEAGLAGLGLQVVLLDVLLVQQAGLVVQQGGGSSGGLGQPAVVTSLASLTSLASHSSLASLASLASLPAWSLLPVVRFLLQ